MKRQKLLFLGLVLGCSCVVPKKKSSKTFFDNSIIYSPLNIQNVRQDSLSFSRVVEYSKYLTLPKYSHSANSSAKFTVNKMTYSSTYFGSINMEKRFLVTVIPVLKKLDFEIENSNSDCNYVVIYCFNNSRYYLIDGFEKTEIKDLYNYLDKDRWSLEQLLGPAYSNIKQKQDFEFNKYSNFISKNIKWFKRNHCNCNVNRKFEKFRVY